MYDFTKVEIKNLDGVILIQNPHKELANQLYMTTKNVDMLELARRINTGEPVELSAEELKAVNEALNGFNAFAKQPFLDYIATNANKRKSEK